jgi:hypothetical protein
MEMDTGKNLTLGQAIGIAAAGILTGIAIAMLIKSLDDEEDEKQ